MDLDDVLEESIVETAATQVDPTTPKLQKKGKLVPIDDEHPFDLDAYISAYSDSAAVKRLLHIANHNPTIAPSTLQLAIQYIQQTSNTQLYLDAMQEYNTLPCTTEPLPVDQKWVEEVSSRNSVEKNRLEVELKQYKSNMIKESIRMGHRDLGDFHRSIGEYQLALHHYVKSREFCMTSQHVMEICLYVLPLLIELRSYPQVGTYVFKAEGVLEATNAKSDGASKVTIANHEIVQGKICLASALAHLGQCNYGKAAYGFIKLPPAKMLGDWLGKIIAASDIAIYGTLCALASLSRSAIRASVLENPTFGAYMEQEPYVREMIDGYMNSKFKTVLELLERYSTRHYMDINLFPHVQELSALIRDRALVLYFHPFQSIRLERMGEAFGMDVEEIERQIVRLIQGGHIQARVDSRNKILQAKGQDPRTAMYSKAVETGTRIQEVNRKLLLRMKLIQADLVVKSQKTHNINALRHEASVHEMLLE